MSELSLHYTDEQTGISYTPIGDYYIPNFSLFDYDRYSIGKYGRMRLGYLKNHRKLTYLNLLKIEKLDVHLHEIEIAANDNIEIICKQPQLF